MSEKLKVLSYDNALDYHVCLDEASKMRRIDLITSGCLPENTKPEELVGKVFIIDYTHPFIEMAEGVRLEEDDTGV